MFLELVLFAAVVLVVHVHSFAFIQATQAPHSVCRT
jgi:hypothetical protein